MKRLICVLLAWTGSQVCAQVATNTLSAQGYSGTSLVPNAKTLSPGSAVMAAGGGVPGAAKLSGFNLSLGFGLLETLEFSGTLAANSWHCNFYQDNCGANEIRDLSTAFKWAPKLPFLNDRGIHVAIGAKDPGGAAVQFKSWYGVVEYRTSNFSAVVGQATGEGASSPLKGTLWSLTGRLSHGIDLNIQESGGRRLASAAWSVRPWHGAPDFRIAAYSVLGAGSTTQNPTGPIGLQRNGVEGSISFDLEGERHKEARTADRPLKLRSMSPDSLQSALHEAGFHAYQFLREPESGHLYLVVENTAYTESPIDAAAVAAALVASRYEQEDWPLTVIIESRGLNAIALRTRTRCFAAWLRDPDRCEDGFELLSLPRIRIPQEAQVLFNRRRSPLRPELIFSPALQSTLGTEVGAFDYDLAVNANLQIPLWRGAYLDFNRLIPTGYASDDFRNFSGAFRPQRMQPGFDRKMIHQLLRWPAARTTLRLSAGTTYKRWEGGQVEAQTVSPGGDHRFAAIWGKFQHPIFVRQNRKEYVQYSYRYAWDERHTQTSQLQWGEFWNGDRGWQFTHRFWYGERNVALHFRQTRFTEAQPLASFAGLSITLPLSPRVTTGWKYLGVRGTNAFSYGFETRMKNEANLVGGGFGVFPATGESIGQIFNRDRLGDDYLRHQHWRLRDAVRTTVPMLEPGS